MRGLLFGVKRRQPDSTNKRLFSPEFSVSEGDFFSSNSCHLVSDTHARGSSSTKNAVETSKNEIEEVKQEEIQPGERKRRGSFTKLVNAFKAQRRSRSKSEADMHDIASVAVGGNTSGNINACSAEGTGFERRYAGRLSTDTNINMKIDRKARGTKGIEIAVHDSLKDPIPITKYTSLCEDHKQIINNPVHSEILVPGSQSALGFFPRPNVHVEEQYRCPASGQRRYDSESVSNSTDLFGLGFYGLSTRSRPSMSQSCSSYLYAMSDMNTPASEVHVNFSLSPIREESISPHNVARSIKSPPSHRKQTGGLKDNRPRSLTCSAQCSEKLSHGVVCICLKKPIKLPIPFAYVVSEPCPPVLSRRLYFQRWTFATMFLIMALVSSWQAGALFHILVTVILPGKSAPRISATLYSRVIALIGIACMAIIFTLLFSTQVLWAYGRRDFAVLISSRFLFA